MIITLAGHVDHGKSALVEALTTTPMQRLPEERRRGMTIELGFAPLRGDDGTLVALIDVPGHDSLVDTMVSGAWAADAALLVVAADDGVAPQTLEHLRILELVGVPQGVVVVSKSDAVDDEWMQLVMAEVGELCARSPISFRGPLAVSAATHQGIEPLRHLLLTTPTRIRETAGESFRLYTDRSFHVAGSGTVVTGTVAEGSVSVGQHLSTPGAGSSFRVRRLEHFGDERPSAGRGARVALALARAEPRDVPRGTMLVAADSPYQPSCRLDVLVGAESLTVVPPRPISVTVLVGTARRRGRLRIGPLAGEGTRLGTLRLVRPLAVRAGDRLVVRPGIHPRTVWGASVLDPCPPLRGRVPGELADVDPVVRLAAAARRRPAGLSSAELELFAGREGGEFARQASLHRFNGVYFHDSAVTAAEERALTAVRRWHLDQPAQSGMPLEHLRRGTAANPDLAIAVVEGLIRQKRLCRSGETVHEPDFRPQFGSAHPIVRRVAAAVAERGLRYSDDRVLIDACEGIDWRPPLRAALASGELVELQRGKWLASEHAGRFRQLLVALPDRGRVDVSQLKAVTGLSRKFLIPLLEWSDATGVTRRMPDGFRTVRLGADPRR